MADNDVKVSADVVNSLGDSTAQIVKDCREGKMGMSMGFNPATPITSEDVKTATVIGEKSPTANVPQPKETV